MTTLLRLIPALILTYSTPAVGEPLTRGDDVVVQPGFSAGMPVERHSTLTFSLSQPLDTSEGIAVFLGETDLSALVERSGAFLRYTPDLIPLPSGNHVVSVYIIDAEGAWYEAGRFPLTVRMAGGLDKAQLKPGLTLGNKGQLAHRQVPSPQTGLLLRERYQDFSGQLSLQGELAHPSWAVQAQANIQGVSYRNEALRFAELQDDAPRIDLASYRVEARRGVLGLRGGHVGHGRHRHLINSFGSRGLLASVDHGSRGDLSVAVLNGSNVVGWRNPLGLSDPDHRILSGTAGLELLHRQPGAIRIEASALSGSVHPRTGFNQGGIPDAERSHGMGLRLVGSTRDRRFRVEGGYAGSRFTNPRDPTLTQDSEIVAVEPETRYAYYVDLSTGLLRNVNLSSALPANLTAGYGRERVDPLYRSVASYVQADVLRNVLELQGSLGPISVQGSHTRSEDNLERIPSILKTLTRQNAVSAGMPIRSLAGSGDAPLLSLLPNITYSYNRTHQFGASTPVDAGFSPTHVPDQVSQIHRADAAWQGRRWNLGYQFGSAFQDNRQEGREAADFLSLTHALSAGTSPIRALSIQMDLNLDRAESKESGRVDYTRRIGARLGVRPLNGLSMSGSFSPTRTVDRLDVSRRVSTNAMVEGSYTFQLSRALLWPLRGQIFVRYVRQTLHNRDLTFDIETDNRSWSVNSGVSLSLF